VHLGLGGDPQSALVKPRKEAQLETVGEWHKVELLYHHITGHLRFAILYFAQTAFAFRKCPDSKGTQILRPQQAEPTVIGHAQCLVYIPYAQPRTEP
jgi:hypothetical protein